jgi:hypothetical protein
MVKDQLARQPVDYSTVQYSTIMVILHSDLGSARIGSDLSPRRRAATIKSHFSVVSVLAAHIRAARGSAMTMQIIDRAAC